MSRVVKELISHDLRRRYESVSSACVVDMTGLNVAEQEQLRRAIRSRTGRVEVIKNRIARHAFKGSPLEPLGKVLQGPCALVTTRESVIDVAKALVQAAKEFKELKLKQAIFEGDPVLVTVQSLAAMKGHRELLAELAMLVGSPGRALAGCLRSPQARLAGCLKTIAEKAA